MEIRNNTNLAFGTRVKTMTVLEAATLKNIESETVADLKPFIDAFWEPKLKAAGNRGYRYYIKTIAGKITEKYPEIKNAADMILEFSKNNPCVKKDELRKFVTPIIEKIGDTIDITI